MKVINFNLFTAFVAVALATASALAAGTDTWGGNTDANWNTAANWTTVGGSMPPANGDSLVFGVAGSSGTSLNNNITSLSVNNFTINSGAGAFTFAGNSLTLTGTLTNNAANNETISLVLGGAGGLTQAGSGTLTLSSANTYSGGTTINAGILIAGNATALGSGSVTLNGGAIRGGVTIANNIVVGSGGGAITTSGAGNFILTGTLSGAGNLTIGGGAPQNATINPQFSTNTMTSGTITLNGNPGIARLEGPGSSSANVDWVFNGGGSDASGTYNFGSFSGTGSYNAYNGNNSQTTLYNIGGNNHNATFSGAQGQTGTGQVLSFLKVGTGAQTFSGASSYTGTTTVENGSLIAGAAVAVGTASPFGNASSAIALGDVTTISSAAAMNPRLYNGGAFTMARTVTVGANNNSLGNASTAFTLGGNTANSSTFSGAITLNQSLVVTQAASGTLTISGGITSGASGTQTITVNNSAPVTIGTGVIGGGTGTIALTENGPSTLTLTGTHTYTGATTVSGGTLLVNGSTASGSTVSVSGSGSVLGGSGTVNGATTISSSGALTPRPSAGSATTTTFGGNLTLSSASANFTLSSSGLSANDKVNYGSSGTLTLDSSDTITITGTPLDAVNDYTLFTSTGGTVSMATRPTLKINGVTSDQISAGSYQLNISGHLLVLHYIRNATPPTVNSAGASPASLGHYQTTTITVNVTPVSGQSITSVTVTADGLGGAGDPVTLTGPGGNGAGNWTGTFTAAGTLTPENYAVSGVVNQNDGGAAAWSATGITVTNSSMVWGGGGSDNKWSTIANWNAGSGPAPGMGDSVAFAGSIQTINNLDQSLGVASLTFNSGAGSFDITNAANTLTLAGGMTNNSSNAQALDVPVALSGAPTISAAAGNIAISGAVSDSGGGLTKAGNGTLTLSGVNTYSGATTISGGMLTIGGAGLLGGGTYAAAITDNGAFNFSSSTNQTLSGGISGSGSLTNSGSGTLTLSGGNSYGGGTTVSAGTVRFSNASAFGPGTITLNGGTIQAGGGYTFANTFTVSGASVFDMAGNNTTLNGNLNGSAALTMNNSSYASTLALNGNNSSYGGTITFNNNNAVDFISANAGSASAAWVFNDGNGGRVRIDIGNNTINFGSMAGVGQIVNNTSSTTSTLSVGALNTSTIFSGTINNNGSGILALTKVGSGSLTLSGANNYTGNTTVSNGTLAITTAQLGNGNYVVNDGATLNIFGPAGSSIAMSGLTLGAGGSSTLGLGGVSSASALVNVTSLTTHGTVTVNIASVSGIGQVPLIKYSGSIGGSGYAFVLGTLPYGVTASLVNNTANQSVDLNVTTNIYGGASKHVLFIGNSFTGYNNLYLQYSNMVVSAGYPNPQVSCYWVGSDDLSGLSGDANALALIAQGGWDYVVLQEQSTEPCAYAQDAGLMSGWMSTLDFFYDDIKSYSPNATVVLYETWAWAPGTISSADGSNQAGMQALLTYAYQAAATNLVNSGRTNVIVAHVGDARLINDNYQNMNMYWDASHPNGPGTYTAGLVIFTTTYDADPLLVTYLEPNTANGSAVNPTDGAYIRSLARYEAYLPQPNPPLYLQAATATNIPVSLTWNPSPIAQLFSPLGRPAAYNIKRSTASGGSYQLVGVTTGTNYTDTAVTNGVTYYYVVSATNSAGESPNSFETSVVPQFVAPPVPATPTNLVATAGNAQVVLGWSATGGATGYNLKRSTTNGGPYAMIASNVSGLAYTNSGLANGTMYYFVVSATNLAGESANSTPASAQPVSPVPTNITCVVSSGQLQLTWPLDHTGWRLLMQTNNLANGISFNTNDWGPVANSQQTNRISLPVLPSQPAEFYRLVYP